MPITVFATTQLSRTKAIDFCYTHCSNNNRTARQEQDDGAHGWQGKREWKWKATKVIGFCVGYQATKWIQRVLLVYSFTKRMAKRQDLRRMTHHSWWLKEKCFITTTDQGFYTRATSHAIIWFITNFFEDFFVSFLSLFRFAITFVLH